MKQQVPRWIAQWPLNLQPTQGSSMSDWTKVEVVPAYAYDQLREALSLIGDKCDVVLGRLADSASEGDK